MAAEYTDEKLPVHRRWKPLQATRPDDWTTWWVRFVTPPTVKLPTSGAPT